MQSDLDIDLEWLLIVAAVEKYPNLFRTEAQVRWAYFNRHRNGLTDAFRKIGGRLHVNPWLFVRGGNHG